MAPHLPWGPIPDVTTGPPTPLPLPSPSPGCLGDFALAAPAAWHTRPTFEVCRPPPRGLLFPTPLSGGVCPGRRWLNEQTIEGNRVGADIVLFSEMSRMSCSEGFRFNGYWDGAGGRKARGCGAGVGGYRSLSCVFCFPSPSPGLSVPSCALCWVPSSAGSLALWLRPPTPASVS